MTTAIQETDLQKSADRRADHVADFERFRAGRGGEPDGLRDLRRRAAERFAEIGFPTLRWEQWRKTDVRPLSQGTFARATGPAVVDREALEPYLIPGAHRLVFVDGFHVAELSDVGELPDGVWAGSLATALAEVPHLVEPHLGRHVLVGETVIEGKKVDENPFAALNTAFFADGAFLHVPRGTVIEEPFHLLFLSTATEGGEPRLSYPRNLLVAGETSQSTVVETYAAAGDPESDVYWCCAATEVVVEPGAVVDHYKVQHESRQAYHVATQQVYQLRDSNFSSHAVTVGGALTRNDVNAYLDGEGVESNLNGLYLVDGSQLVDNHMRVDHAKPHGDSHELYKGVLDDQARSVFNGLIHVHQDAQKTDAKQTNRNLLLSRGALASSNPQLEIFADDVKCTHGSTVGQLDREAVFYLRSRGIGEEAAKSLLTYAFAADIVARIKVEPLRQDLEELLFRRLPRGEVVRQAV